MKQLVLAAALSLATFSCTQTPKQEAIAKEPIKVYALSGTVIGLQPDIQGVLIKHEEIKGWMDAMTMTFPVKEKAEFEKFKPGQKITADVNVQGDDFWISKIVWLP